MSSPAIHACRTLPESVRWVLASLCLTMGLGACAGLPRQGAAAALPPLAMGLPEAADAQSQVLDAAFADRSFTLSCGESTTAAGWRSVCVDPLGQRVFTLALTADGQPTAERGAGVPDSLDARRVLADVQLARWPLAALETAFAGSAWRVVQVSADTRRLTLDGRLHTEVHYASAAQLWRGTHWLVNVQQGYSLAIRPEVGAP